MPFWVYMQIGLHWFINMLLAFSFFSGNKVVCGERPWNIDSLINCVTLGIVVNLIESQSPHM